MGLQIERIPTFGDNYTYLAICDETNDAAIIDAPEEDPVVARVEATGANVTLILSTHHHFDHSMANPQLAERYGAPVYGHVSDQEQDRLPGQTKGIDEGDTSRSATRPAASSSSPPTPPATSPTSSTTQRPSSRVTCSSRPAAVVSSRAMPR